jgi:hypothetical protein
VAFDSPHRKGWLAPFGARRTSRIWRARFFDNLLSVTGGHWTKLWASAETWLAGAKFKPHLQLGAKANPASGRESDTDNFVDAE